MTSWRSVWQRADSEDERTALVFGFLRHAPVDVALQPLLEGILGVAVRVDPLERRHFWPAFPSGSGRVIPDLCFPAAVAGERAMVVVEAKRTTEPHPRVQIRAEAAAAARDSSRPDLVVVLTVGSRGDIGDLTPVVQEAVGEGVRGVHEHVPWTRLGDFIGSVADPAWAVYADDVLDRLRRYGLMRDPARPTLPPGVTPQAAVEAVNRLTLSAHDFLVDVDDRIGRPASCGLAQGQVWRTGTSEGRDRLPVWRTQGVVYGAWARRDWDDRQRVLVAVDLVAPDGPLVLVGPAWAKNGYLTPMMLEGSETVLPSHRGLDQLALHFGQRRAYMGRTEMRDFRFVSRPWSQEPAADREWLRAEFHLALDVAKRLGEFEADAWGTTEPTGEPEEASGEFPE